MTDDDRVVVPRPDPTQLTTTQLLREIDHVQELFASRLSKVDDVHGGRLERIDLRLNVIEERRRELKEDTAKAVDTAFMASAEQAKLQFDNFKVAVEGIRTVVDDLKERVVKMESTKIGAMETRETQRLDINLLIAAAAVIVSVTALILYR